MKTILVIPCLLSYAANADFGNFDQVVSSVNAQLDKLNQTLSIGRSSAFGFRDVSSQSSMRLQVLSEYGCWCYRGQDNFGKGLGQTVDRYDEICRSHHQGYECIHLDADSNGASGCDPIAVSNAGYIFSTEMLLDDDGQTTMQLTCEESQDWCTLKTCQVDLRYINDFWSAGMEGDSVDQATYSHDSGFDIANCPIGGKVYQPYKRCCGRYPKRWVYKTSAEDETGHRQCCDLEGGSNLGETRSRAFLIDSQVCCGVDGVQDGSTCA